MSCRSVLHALCLAILAQAAFGAPAALNPAQASREPQSELDWFDAGLLTVEGRGFDDTVTTFTRLPKSALPKLTEALRNLSNDSAGICVRFETDSTSVSAVWETDKVAGMGHMARTGSNGLDLYRREKGGWKYQATARPNTTRTLVMLDANSSETMNEYLLYLPTYSCTKELKIGVAKGRALRPAKPRDKSDLPIVFYGTSITQGGCSSRAGMCHVAILGRWLDKEVINLGFSGSGKGEPETAEVVASIPAAVYVMEPLPNMKVDMMKERYRPFVKVLREKNPTTPIVLVEHPLFTGDAPHNVELKAIYRELKESGDKNVYFLPTDKQLAGRENGTVDGVHPTDLGFYWMAEAYEPLLRKILK